MTPDRASRNRHWTEPLAGNPEWRVVVRQRADGLWESVLMDSDANMASSVGGFGTEAEARDYGEGGGNGPGPGNVVYRLVWRYRCEPDDRWRERKYRVQSHSRVNRWMDILARRFPLILFGAAIYFIDPVTKEETNWPRSTT